MALLQSDLPDVGSHPWGEGWGAGWTVLGTSVLRVKVNSMGGRNAGRDGAVSPLRWGWTRAGSASKHGKAEVFSPGTLPTQGK